MKALINRCSVCEEMFYRTFETPISVEGICFECSARQLMDGLPCDRVMCSTARHWIGIVGTAERYEMLLCSGVQWFGLTIGNRLELLDIESEFQMVEKEPSMQVAH